MKEKVVEILVYIMSEIQENKRLQEIDIGELKSKGYTQSEISAAFSWLYDNVQFGEVQFARPSQAARSSRRVFHEAEKQVLSTESQGYLIQLRELGLLDDRDLESVIERAMMAGYEKLSVEEVRDIVTAVLFAKQSGGSSSGHSMLSEGGESIH
jgi:uncharacterized protein Smg (DUF494 family)